MVDDDLSDLARILLGKLCRTHGDGGRPVAVALVARALESRLGSLLERERSVLARGRDGRVDQLFKLFANLHGTHLSLADGSFVYTSHDSTMFPSVWGTQPPRVSLDARYAENIHTTSDNLRFVAHIWYSDPATDERKDRHGIAIRAWELR